jgi:hypothetical protein
MWRTLGSRRHAQLLDSAFFGRNDRGASHSSALTSQVPFGPEKLIGTPFATVRARRQDGRVR